MQDQGSSRIRVPFHWLAAVLLLGFVLMFAAALTYVSLDGLQRLTKERALATFTGLAEQDAHDIQQLLSTATSIVHNNARLPAYIVVEDGTLNTDLLVDKLITNLRSNTGLYGAFIGMADGESLRVLAIRKDPAKEAALGAPAGTFWAVQHIAATPDGQKLARWQFLTEFRESLTYSAPGTLYSARERPWWKSARENPGLQVAGPYFFLEAHELGVTVASALEHVDGVIGMAVSLNSISQTLKASLNNHQGGIVVMDKTGRAVGAHASDPYGLPDLSSLDSVAASSNPLYAIAAGLDKKNGSELVNTEAGEFVYVRREIGLTESSPMHLVAFSPVDAYAGPMRDAHDKLLIVTLVLLLVMVPLALLAARRLTRPLEGLTDEAARIQALDFSDTAAVRSPIAEVDTLGLAQHLMKDALRERTESLDQAMRTLESLAESGIQLATEQKESALMQLAVNCAVQLLDARVGQYWSLEDEGGLRLAAGHGFDMQTWASTALPDTANDPCNRMLEHTQVLRIDSDDLQHVDLSLQTRLLGQPPKSLMLVPVMIGTRLCGVLLLADALNARGEPGAFSRAQERYATTLAAQTAVALQNVQLQKAQGEIMDSMIQMIAGAIDAKSPYTAGHCNRVPELAFLLMEAVNAQTQGPFADFRMDDEDEWREFRIGAWLHDCGKVTTPEYVVDKATKLEIIYNRIHEIRMRFEVLLRDADIARLRAIADGADAETENQCYAARQAQLHEQFAFIASCNIGGEFMPAEACERLREIGQQTWRRHFDDRLGLAHGELSNRQHIEAQPLPAVEYLLADKAEHIIPRTEAQRYDEHHQFQIDVPEHLYNFGELHNLCVQRGTLSAEERFKINEHIMQTIVMLEQLQLPDNLRRVPEYAGTHHETMTGTGYPRKLDGSQLSIPSRIMAVADIFEALTAADRPYKKAKTLSEAVQILSFFKKDGHIDPDLFDLMLSSGVYLEYAQRYLDSEQIDAVDVDAYLGEAPTN